MKSLALASFVLAGFGALIASAAIDGTVTNGTTGKPQAGVTISLIKPGQQGMQTLGTKKTDQQGHFLFENDRPGGGPELLQADFQGVNYNTLLTPNMPRSGVDVRIYNATKSPADARIMQHMIVLEPGDGQTSVNETFILQNASNETFANPGLGGIRFYLPTAADGQVKVSVQGPGGMPLPRPAEKTDEPNVLKVDYADKARRDASEPQLYPARGIARNHSGARRQHQGPAGRAGPVCGATGRDVRKPGHSLAGTRAANTSVHL